MADDQGYDIPEQWCQALSGVEKDLCQVPGWSVFKERSGPLFNEMNMDPMTTEQSMVIVLYSLYYDDPEWSLDQVREDPTEKEEKEDFARFQKALKRLVDAAPEILSDFKDTEADVVIDIGGNRVSVPLEPERATNSRNIEKVSAKNSGRFVMGYQLPTGKIKGMNSDHAVLGGWMTQDAWDKVKFSREQELTPDERESFNRWRNDHQQSESLRKRVEKDENDLRDWIKNKLSADPNLITPGPTQTAYARIDFGIQCFLLAMLPKLSRRPSWMSIQDWVENELGLDSIDDLYPVVTSDGRTFQLDDLIFNFGYGPNYFDWTKQKPYKLKGTPSTLYLICMDVGKIADRESAQTWKIGITQKSVTGSSSREARFYGKVGENVRVIREKLYKDGRDAFMVEQTIIMMSRQETHHDRERLGCLNEKSKAFEALESLDRRVILELGYSEWIYPYKAEEEVISIYERMTSYGEFHGDGNVAYYPFKRDFNKV
jgi:hypothetical protein